MVLVERSQVDILAVNETWIRQGEKARAPTLSGYSFHHELRSVIVRSNPGGGVDFYITGGVNVYLAMRNLSQFRFHWANMASNNNIWKENCYCCMPSSVLFQKNAKWSAKIRWDLITTQELHSLQNDCIVMLFDFHVYMFSCDQGSIIRVDSGYK